MREPKLDFIDDGPDNRAGIYRHMRRRPIFAFGNSAGDREMLEYPTNGPGRRLAMIAQHDDAVRELAYERTSSIGRLEKVLNEARARGWVPVCIKDDWKQALLAAK